MQSKAAMLVELERLLIERRDNDEKSVLIVDEAQSLPLDLLEEIRLLANMETADDKLLSVIIAGQPELAARLNERSLRQFKQRVALRCELKPLTSQETATYIVGRIRAAGGVAAEVFTRQAVSLMHERAQGLPRTISVIADNALLAGYAAGRRPVGAELVAEICRDFDIVPQAPLEEHKRLLDVAPVTAPAASAPVVGEGGLFGSFSSKRKRFWLFPN
jgi:type II secretory pathway predicted ATPase ExeA